MTSLVSWPRLRAVKPFALSIAIAAAFPPSTFAQTAEDKTFAPIVVTATRSPQAARDVLADNIVITSEEIAQSGLASLSELLQKKRGIEISTNGGQIGRASCRERV